MARINLLPWREERRRQLTQEFIRQAALAAVLAGAAGAYAWYHATGLLEAQEARNAYLEDQIAVLSEEIREIEEIEAKREELISRMEIVQDLQRRRPQAVHLFDQIAEHLPDGVHLAALWQSDDDLTVQGWAESNARVSAYMRNLDSSDWLTEPRIEVIETDDDDRVSSFTLHLAQTMPGDEEDNGDGGDR